MKSSDADLDRQGRIESLRTAAIVLVVLLAGFAIFFGGKATSVAENKASSEASQKFTLAQQVAAACASSDTAEDLGGLCQKADQIVKQGPAGSVGLQGPPGAQGNDGPLGPKGEQGIQGIIGIQGLQGLLGKGVNGETGAVGPQGETGIGETGPKGDTGLNGTNGTNGIDGKNAPTIAGIDCGTASPDLSITVHLSDGTSYTATCDPIPTPTPTPTPTK